jgi:shikimate dehydrogenase
VAAITVVDPIESRARGLAERLQREFPRCRVSASHTVPADANMIVNASTVGMDPSDGLPGDIGSPGIDTLFGDVVITDLPTPLIRLAIDRGCRYVTGREMMGGQAQAIFDYFMEPLLRR